MRLLASRYVLAVRVAAIGAALCIPAACDNAKDTLLDAPIPTVIDPAAVQNADGAESLRIGAFSRLRTITAGSGAGDSPWMFAGLLTDEWKSSDTFSQRNETDQRLVQTNNANLTPILRDLYRTRNSAREALNSLTQYKPDPAYNLGQMYFTMAMGELYLAEWFCNGIPLGDASTGAAVYGTTSYTNAEVYAFAKAHLDSALTLAPAGNGSTPADTIRYSASIALGRVLIEQGKFAEAAAAVANVPTAFQLKATFSLTSGSNQIWSLNTSAKRWTVGDSFDASGIIKNSLPFASAGDPRVPVKGSSTGTSASGRGFDGATNLVALTTFARTDPTPMLSGLDARLIEAEAKLNANDIAGMMTILNNLRTNPQNLGTINTPVMAALATPASQTAAVDLFFREKAFWTYSRGQRLGDLRRLIRIYGRTQDNVFPTGTFFKGGSYGPDVNFPVTVDEQNNPIFTDCIDRKA
jgi:hypothetical protein